MFSFFVSTAYAAASPVPELSDLNDIFINILKAALALAGIAALLVILAGGFKYITSAGDEKAMQDAQKTLSFAVIGLVLAVASYYIIKFIGGDFLGVDPFNFSVTLP